MKKSFISLALAVALVLTFAATASATSAKTWNYQEDYYSWGSNFGNGIQNPEASAGSNDATNTLGNGGMPTVFNTNVANPGVHANYQTTTAKCGICHSVHRAKSGGTKLLNSATASCAGCHIAGASTVTDVVIAWGTDAAPLAGPHGSSSNGTDTPTSSCATRACHATSPHGAGGSTYALFRSKLLTAAVDAQVADALADSANSGVTAAFLAGDMTGFSADEADSVRTGYTCASEGCHEQTQLPVIRKGWSELREQIYPLGNIAGNQILKTGHMTGTAAANNAAASYAPIAGCTSCHDQADGATRTGYTFPHAQRATGTGSGTQTFLWYTIAGSTVDAPVDMTTTNMKSFDGACLKCHNSGAAGIGITH